MKQKIVVVKVENEDFEAWHYGLSFIPDEKAVRTIASGFNIFDEVTAHYEVYYTTGRILKAEDIEELYANGEKNFINECEKIGVSCTFVEAGILTTEVEEKQVA